MKAIVLSCDKYHPLTLHMMHRYQALWPDHPFVFRVPFQKSAEPLKTAFGDRVEPVQTDPGIKQTVLTLIEDLPDDQWVYWCIDDKYPIKLDTARVRDIFHWIATSGALEASGLMFTRCRRLFKEAYLMPERFSIRSSATLWPRRLKFIRRADWSQFWLHQFLRVGVIRYLFERLPDRIPQAKELDRVKNQQTLPDHHRLFVTARNVSVFGESTRQGKLTRNVVRSMKQMGQPLPDGFQTIDDEVILRR